MTDQRIFFVQGDKRIPFAEWILSKKEEYGFTWDELNELTEVNRVQAYANNITNGKPNNPSTKTFEKIISALDHNLDDFEINYFKNTRGKPDNYVNEEDLKKVGDKAIEKRFLAIRSPLIRKVLGEAFYCSHCKENENMIKFVEALKKIDPDKYGHLKYLPQKQDRGMTKALEEKEKEILLKVINEMTYSSDKWERLPRGINDQAQTKLAASGFNRTRKSVVYHVSKLCGKRKRGYQFGKQTLSKKDLASLVEGLERNLFD